MAPRPRHGIAAIAALGVAALVSLWPARARAQACCTATASDEFAVVARCHDAVLAAQIGYERALGSFDSGARYRALDGSVVGAAQLVLGAGARLYPRSLQIGGSLPILLQHRHLQGLDSSTAAGTGDATLALRWTAITDRIEPASWSEPTTLLPYVDLIAGSRIPTGRAPEDSRTSSGVDATGTGAWTPFVGVKLSKFLSMSNVIAVDVRYAHPMSRDVRAPTGTKSLEPGDEVTLKGSWLHLHGLLWNAGLFVDLQLAGSRSEDGELVADSDARRLRFGGHVGHVFDYPNWEISAGVASDAFWSGPSKNVPYAGPSASLTVTRHF